MNKFNSNSFIVSLLILIESISKMKLTVWSLAMHLNYYGIANYISNFKFILTGGHLPSKVSRISTELNGDDNSDQVMAHKLWKVSQLIDQLAKSSQKLQSVYSLSVLIILSASFVSCTISLFVIIQELFQPILLEINVYLEIVSVATHISLVLIVIISADMPSHEVIISIRVNMREENDFGISWVLQVGLLRQHVMQLSTELRGVQDNTEVMNKCNQSSNRIVQNQ